MIEVDLLGPLAVRKDGAPVELRRQKQRALLALLALHRREVVAPDVLIDELWEGNPPPTARDALQNYISQLRKALGPEAIETRPQGYVLDLAEERTDVGRFEGLTAKARAALDAARRAALLADALSLWRGQPMSDLAYERFAATEAARLEELRAVAEEDFVDAALELGRHAELVPRLEAIVESRPYDERARAQLMVALYRSARQAEALEVFREAREALAEELGLDPSPTLRELERAILLQEPSLVATYGEITEERRKTVTVLSVELSPADEAEPERLQAALIEDIATARAAIERHEGWVTTRAGDELLGIFGVPVAHEDDALRAVRAAVELRDGIGADGVRIGIEAGPALTGHGFITGDVTRVAGRLQRIAGQGEIAVGAAALTLVRHAVSGRRARGAFILGAVEPEAPAAARLADAPLVGREQELRALVERLEDARQTGQPQLVALVGEPGIGKSRLARELAGRVAGLATVLTGRCVAYGEGASYRALRDIVGALDLQVALAGAEDAALVAERVRELVGLAHGTVSLDEGLWAFRRLLESVARNDPLVVVLEDLHWAEERLLDLVDELVLRARGSMLLLAIGRPELLDAREAWQEGALSLRPLEAEDVAAMVAALERSLEPAASARIADIAEGNPLFAEQLLAYAEERGANALTGVPPSVEALLAARLDLLEPAARSTAQRAALVGREFERAAVDALSATTERGGLSSDLLQLVGRGLVHPAPGGDERFRFHHALVRDVAYESLPKAERADLHELYGDWLAEQPGAADEVVGYHLEQAHRYLTELRSADRRARQLAADAGARLGSAGMETWRRSDVPATIDLLGRSTGLLPAGSLRRALLCELGVACFAGGDTARAQQTLVEALELSCVSHDPLAELRARLELASVRLQRDPEGQAQELLDTAARAAAIFEAAGDHRALGRSWLLVGFVEGGHHCRNKAWEEAAERALVHYAEAGWPATTPIGQLCAALYYGPTDASTAVARCEALLDGGGAGPTGRAQILRYLAGLVSMRGEFARGRALSAEAQEIFEELGQTAPAAHSRGVRGDIELLAGDAAAARSEYEALCHFCEEHGEVGALATYASDLAEAHYQLDGIDEAERWARVAERHASSDDIGAQFAWRAVLARVLARGGDHTDAERIAREAVAIAEPTDALNKRAAVQLGLAEVWRLVGNAAGAADAVGSAIALYELKGNGPAAERAHLFAGTLRATQRSY